jgi:hypothetical protein
MADVQRSALEFLGLARTESLHGASGGVPHQLSELHGRGPTPERTGLPCHGGFPTHSRRGAGEGAGNHRRGPGPGRPGRGGPYPRVLGACARKRPRCPGADADPGRCGPHRGWDPARGLAAPCQDPHGSRRSPETGAQLVPVSELAFPTGTRATDAWCLRGAGPGRFFLHCRGPGGGVSRWPVWRWFSSSPARTWRT